MAVTGSGGYGDLSLAISQRLEQLVLEVPHEAVRQVLLGGKRLRPILCLLVGEALGASEGDRLLDAAAALECIHCAALMHDDVLDGHETRRGRPTLVRRLGEKATLMIGDLLLGLAFRYCPEETMGILGHCLSELSRAACQEMWGPRLPSLDERRAVMEGKTACLFEAACRCGARIAGSSCFDVIGRYGRSLGLAFQMADDLSDLHDSIRGGSLQGDLAARQVTYPLLRGDLPATVLQNYVAATPLDESELLTLLRERNCQAATLGDIASLREDCQWCLRELNLHEHHGLSHFFGFAIRAVYPHHVKSRCQT